MTTNAANKARQAGNSDAVTGLARVGLVAYGVVHLLIAWLALQIAWGSGAGTADSAGALRTIAQQPFGRALLWLIAVGLLALALWQASETVWGYRGREQKERVKKQVESGVKAVLYLVLAVGAAAAARGSASSGGQEQEATSGVLALPAGQAIVVVVGLVVIGAGAAEIVKGAKRTFLDEIDTGSMSASAREGVQRLGQAGYLAKGTAVAVIGALLVYAAVTFDPQKAQGLDGALQTIVQQPFGRVLLTAVALGFAAFGVFSVLQSRYRRM